MDKKKKFTLFASITSLFILVLYFLNKLIFCFASLTETLYRHNNHYYNWRFGKIFYMKCGNGKPVLLIHDLTCASSEYEWKKLIQSLSQTNTVYSIDLLGCGRSEKPKITYTSYLYVQLVNDFIKNIIKQKTSIITSGYSCSIGIMSCYLDESLYNKLILINPSDLAHKSIGPTYKQKIVKYMMEAPIIGTTFYNIITSKFALYHLFKNHYFFQTNNISRKYISAYYEAAHLNGSCSKFMYSSIVSHFTNTNIVHALKTINHSIYIISGQFEENQQLIARNYIELNPSIEAVMVSNSKHLPHLENHIELLKLVIIFLND